MSMSIRGNICKHAIKVNWLYFQSDNSNPLLHQHAEDNICNDPPEINIEPQNHDVYVDATIMETNIVDSDAKALHLEREDFLSYTHIILDNPPTTLTKTIQLTGMLKKCWMKPIIFTLLILTSHLDWVFLIHL